MQSRDWAPFTIAPMNEHAPAPRSIDCRDGVGDRLRAAAFAEIQAREAFNWAADFFADAPENLRAAWRKLALAEDRHLHWLLNRMKELGFAIDGREVSDHLWHSLVACKTAQEFAIYMANAEERGRKAGERFHRALEKSDPVSSQIFGKIAQEEIAHIALAQRFFPEAWSQEGIGPKGVGSLYSNASNLSIDELNGELDSQLDGAIAEVEVARSDFQPA